MAESTATQAGPTGRPQVTISEKSYEMLTNIRDVLDQASEQAIKDNELYAGRIITDLLDQVEDALTRVTNYTKRVKVASKRKNIKARRKQMRGAPAAKSA